MDSDFNRDNDNGKKRRKSSAHIRILFSAEIPVFPEAKCRTTQKPLWDLEIDRESKHERVNRHNQGRKICDDCPERRECKQWAEINSMYGMWGGKIFAPEWHKYPRCSVCDHALALTMNAERKLDIGYVLPHPFDPSICVECGVAIGIRPPAGANILQFQRRNTPRESA